MTKFEPDSHILRVHLICNETSKVISYQSVLMVQMKNWEPLVFGPALAMDRVPGPVCFSLKFSSSNLCP